MPPTAHPATTPDAPPTVAALERAFEAGDFAALRAWLAQAGAAAEPRLRAAVVVDPAMVAVLAGCAVALLAVLGWYLG